MVTVEDGAPLFTVNDALAEQPPPLVVTVTVYVPAVRLLRFCVVLPLLHAKERGVGVPPEVVILIEPSLPPSQVVFVTVAVTVGVVHTELSTGFVN